MLMKGVIKNLQKLKKNPHQVRNIAIRGNILNVEFDNSPDCECCCVVDQDCEHPSGGDWCEKLLQTECYSCGLKVCKNCSSIRKFHYAKKRLCNNCQIELDGHSYNVMKRMYRKAGYNLAYTKADLKSRGFDDDIPEQLLK